MSRIDSFGEVVFPDESPPSDGPRETLYSPPSSGMGSAGSVHNTTGSNDGHFHEPHIYEDVVSHQGPPKIAPVSGVLAKGKVVIRPIAFKPVVTPTSVRTPSHLSTYSGDSEPPVTAKGSDGRSYTYSTVDTPASSSYVSSALRLDDFAQTPSPSDSGVAELEAMLREKDSEISYLRETMEHNEQVIFKVYEEKEISWQREVRKIKAQCDARLKAAQQNALVKIYQLQQDKRKLKQDVEELQRDKESAEQQIESLRSELEMVRAQLEETEWVVCQKTGEISLLKSQLKDSQGDQTTRVTELLALKAQLKKTKATAEEKEQELQSLHSQLANLKQETCDTRAQLDMSVQSLQSKTREAVEDMERRDVLVSDLRQEVEKFKNELSVAKMDLEAQKEMFEEERVKWREEKDKVICYQKWLKQHYEHMYWQNLALDLEIKYLTLQLEGRDCKIISNESHC